MEQDYFVAEAADRTGAHFVHRGDCQVIPDEGMIDLGRFEDCTPALAAARDRDVGPVDGCALCCPDCHGGD
ncbi:hypothetical protein DXV76_02945 [Rhodobacteraceae bacterium CCMM004]|nr:hypothetical protein DXV76_02945 [Rhodobacteraceae bacterium CCMM004]